MTVGGFPLGDYLIAALIDRSQFGTVHRARSTKRDIDVALKHVASGVADGEAKIEAESRGAKLQAQFCARHPQLVPEIYEQGRAANGDYYISMELVDGRPLTRLTQHGAVEAHKAVGIAVAIGEFLEKLHGFQSDDDSGLVESIVHSDLKPDHVLVLADGSIRILDFGITKDVRAAKSWTVNAWASTPYASPERLEDGTVDADADFWALGVMLFEMVAGYHPYHAYMGNGHPATLARAIRTKERPADLPSSCNRALAAIVVKMLAPQLESRYRRAEDIVGDLRNFVAGRPVVAEAEQAKAGQATTALPNSKRSVNTVGTTPIPKSAEAVDRSRETPPAARAAAIDQPWMGVAARTLVSGLLILGALLEAVATVRGERLRQRIGALQPVDVPSVRAELADVRAAAPFALALPLRVHRPLRERLIMLAKRPILDYRTDMPATTEAQWKQAQASVRLALELSPGDNVIAAREQYMRAHLLRIEAQGKSVRMAQPLLEQAVAAFRESAQLDPTARDPYLGLARIHTYDMRDVDALLRDIQDAEARGHASGRRERAQQGDAYRFRADKARQQATSLLGAERRRLLRDASSDYQNCIVKFTGLGRYYAADQNLAYCTGHFERLQTEIREPLH